MMERLLTEDIVPYKLRCDTVLHNTSRVASQAYFKSWRTTQSMIILYSIIVSNGYSFGPNNNQKYQYVSWDFAIPNINYWLSAGYWCLTLFMFATVPLEYAVSPYLSKIMCSLFNILYCANALQTLIYMFGSYMKLYETLDPLSFHKNTVMTFLFAMETIAYNGPFRLKGFIFAQIYLVACGACVFGLEVSGLGLSRTAYYRIFKFDLGLRKRAFVGAYFALSLLFPPLFFLLQYGLDSSNRWYRRDSFEIL